MAVDQWSLPRLILALLGWLIGFPIVLVGALVLGLGNVGFTLPTLLILLVLWFAPVAWLVARWRRRRGSRPAADAA